MWLRPNLAVSSKSWRVSTNGFRPNLGGSRPSLGLPRRILGHFDRAQGGFDKVCNLSKVLGGFDQFCGDFDQTEAASAMPRPVRTSSRMAAFVPVWDGFDQFGATWTPSGVGRASFGPTSMGTSCAKDVFQPYCGAVEMPVGRCNCMRRSGTKTKMHIVHFSVGACRVSLWADYRGGMKSRHVGSSRSPPKTCKALLTNPLVRRVLAPLPVGGKIGDLEPGPS